MIAETNRRIATPNRHVVPTLVGVLLVCLYLYGYFADPAVPGNHGRFPFGWWGWWDQSQYLRSARALAHLDLDSRLHWYPFGYAMLGAPFSALSPLHAFLLPDLLCYLAAYVAFLVFARAVAVGPVPASLLFLLGTAGGEALRRVWAEPWNTSLSAALIWSLLALTARLLSPPDPVAASRRRRLSWLLAAGAVAGLIPVTRPTDALLVAIWAIGFCLCARRGDRVRLGDLAGLAAGFALVVLPCAALWLRIYGFGPNAYMVSSRSLGFDVEAIGWKSYLLLLSPAPWFSAGAGITERLPWVLFGLAGITSLPWLAGGPARRLLVLLATMIVAYSLLFFAYVDLIPSGLWRYNNIHYFKWTFPGLALFGFLLLRRLATRPRWPVILVTAATALVCMTRLRPYPVAEADPAWMVQIAAPTPGWDAAYFATMQIRDDRGVMQSIRDFRALPDSHGWRLIGLRRPFFGSLLISGTGPVPPVWAHAGTLRWGRSLSLPLICRLWGCAVVPP